MEKYKVEKVKTSKYLKGYGYMVKQGLYVFSDLFKTKSEAIKFMKECAGVGI